MGKRYLGDAVYAEFDGERLTLTTEDGIVNPTNEIHIDRDTWVNLIRYIKDLQLVAEEVPE